MLTFRALPLVMTVVRRSRAAASRPGAVAALGCMEARSRRAAKLFGRRWPAALCDGVSDNERRQLHVCRRAARVLQALWPGDGSPGSSADAGSAGHGRNRLSCERHTRFKGVLAVARQLLGRAVSGARMAGDAADAPTWHAAGHAAAGSHSPSRPPHANGIRCLTIHATCLQRPSPKDGQLAVLDPDGCMAGDCQPRMRIGSGHPQQAHRQARFGSQTFNTHQPTYSVILLGAVAGPLPHPTSWHPSKQLTSSSSAGALYPPPRPAERQDAHRAAGPLRAEELLAFSGCHAQHAASSAARPSQEPDGSCHDCQGHHAGARCPACLCARLHRRGGHGCGCSELHVNCRAGHGLGRDRIRGCMDKRRGMRA